MLFNSTEYMFFLSVVFVAYWLLGSGTLKGYMLEKSLIEQPVVYHADTSEVEDCMSDLAISRGTYYTKERMLRFRCRQHPDSTYAPVLAGENIRMLESIVRVFRRCHTRCKVVVSPLFNQIKFNPADLQALRDVFGKDNVYDFSGMSDITPDYSDYYEDSHFRPAVARRLMDSVYCGSLLKPINQHKTDDYGSNTELYD